ncbi:MAG: hypothetical protein HC938_11830 [Nitrospira sp.]|nr:hypothetical protein [Nitrospira sp.]
MLGGAASGKSDTALRLAGLGSPHAFVATGQGLDDEMIERIARHRATRSSVWETVESRSRWRRGLPSMDLGTGRFSWIV